MVSTNSKPASRQCASDVTRIHIQIHTHELLADKIHTPKHGGRLEEEDRDEEVKKKGVARFFWISMPDGAGRIANGRFRRAIGRRVKTRPIRVPRSYSGVIRSFPRIITWKLAPHHRSDRLWCAGNCAPYYSTTFYLSRWYGSVANRGRVENSDWIENLLNDLNESVAEKLGNLALPLFAPRCSSLPNFTSSFNTLIVDIFHVFLIILQLQFTSFFVYFVLLHSLPFSIHIKGVSPCFRTPSSATNF